jgi:hypothetical protein
MDGIIAVLAVLIVGSILLQLVRMGISTYKLNSATNGVAGALQKGQETARGEGEQIKVFFDSKAGRFGVDRNRNNRLDNVEAEELPSGIGIAEDAVVTFNGAGKLARGSEKPRINLSNNRSSRMVSVSSVGVIEIE